MVLENIRQQQTRQKLMEVVHPRGSNMLHLLAELGFPQQSTAAQFDSQLLGTLCPQSPSQLE